MEKDKYSTPVSLAKVEITDDFWKSKMELVRKEIIPYQWEALNDRGKVQSQVSVCIILR